MIPWLSKNDMEMFYKYLDKIQVYFEYGSGGSTYQANIRNNIRKIYSVESDIRWHNNLKNIVKSDKIQYIYNEMDTRPYKWGYPGPNATIAQKKNYSDHIKNLTKEEQDNIDFVFIDGRFRVACCLKCFDIINDNCLICFDDFLDRPFYHIVLDYYDIVESTIDKRMAILKKKQNISSIPEDIISKYELIKD